MKSRKMGVSRKLLLASVISIMIAVAITGSIGYWVAGVSIVGKMKSVDIKNIVELKADKIESRLARAIETSRNFCSDPAVTMWFENYERDALLGSIVKKKLTQLQEDYDYFTSFAVSNRTFNYWTANNKLLDRVSSSDPDDSWFFDNIKKKERVQINIDYNKELGETGVFLNVMIGKLENPTGVAGVGFRLDDVIKELFVSQKGLNDTTVLINKSGQVIISPDKDSIGRNISSIYPEQTVKEILAGINETSVIEYEEEGSGADMIMACSPIKAADLIVVNQMKKMALLKSLDDIALSTLLSAIAAVIFVTLLFIILSNRLIKRPVRGIMEFAERLSNGDLTERVELDREDEFGNIARALNDSADNLEKLISEIMLSADNLAGVAGEISEGNDNLAQRTNEQASALEEVAATIEEATSSIKQNSENSVVANDMSSKAVAAGSDGLSVSEETIQSIKEINDSSSRIGEIIQVINEIAFQTNLLALNAAVEAARAGEQGRGFAVVAGEVRNLAQRSGEAAKEIADLISDSIEKVEKGTVLVTNSIDSLQQIVRSIKETGELISQITVSTEEQSRGMDQINTAIDELDKMTQQNSALVEQIAASGESMSDQAEDLKKMIGTFTINTVS